MKTIGIGIQDFAKIADKNMFYIDKTAFLKEWWENQDSVTLITRPRRFGKTLLMSMTDYFFSVNHFYLTDETDCFYFFSFYHTFLAEQRTEFYSSSSSNFLISTLQVLSISSFFIYTLSIGKLHSKTIKFIYKDFGYECIIPIVCFLENIRLIK